MISEHNMASLIGADVTGLDGSRIGAIGQILVDPATGRPSWAMVRIGLLGRSAFVPLDEADAADGEVHVPYSRALVKAAPRVGRSSLSAADEDQLALHYRPGDQEEVRSA